MYSIISSLATPIIVINAARNYFAWYRMTWNRKMVPRAEALYRRQTILNNEIAASIFFTGAAAVYVHAIKFQKPTPLIMAAMAYRMVAIALISFATGYSGAAVNLWCFRQATSREP